MHLDEKRFSADDFEKIISINILADKAVTLEFDEKDTLGNSISVYRPELFRHSYPIFQMQSTTVIDQNWIKLLTSAQEQKVDILSSELPPAILKAYEMLRIDSLPDGYKDWYITQDWPTQSIII